LTAASSVPSRSLALRAAILAAVVLGALGGAPAMASTSGGAPAGTVEARSIPTVLEAIAVCESGGDPSAVSADGRYRGKYQFSRDTWSALGGSGDPADASESEQDRLALALYRSEGIKPWPACGRAATAAERRP
jgi:hypothetical protein